MKTQTVASIIVGLIAFLGHPLTASPTIAEVESIVRRADQAWAAAVATRSVDEVLGFYDVDALTAGSAMFEANGRDAFREAWTRVFSDSGFELRWVIDKVVVTRDCQIAYSTGTWTSRQASGPYLAVWRLQRDGSWKVVVDAAWLPSGGDKMK